MKQNNLNYDKNILEFLTVAMEFCVTLENAIQYSQKDFIGKITKIMPLLYLKADLMPDFDSDGVFGTEEFVTEENYDIVRNNIAAMLGQHDDYLDVFVEDMKYSDKPILATVSENLADIYQDLKNFVMVYKMEAADDIINEAIAVCKDNFKFYWGQRLVNVMRPLHELKFQLEEDEP